MRPWILFRHLALWTLLSVASLVGPAVPISHAQAPSSPSDDMSLEEMVRDASAMVSSIREALSFVERALEAEMEVSDDAQRVEFIQARLTSIEGFARVAEEALESLTAVSGGDRSEAVHHWNLVFVSSERVRVLAMQVEQYSGSISRYTGDTQRTPNIDPRIPDLMTWLMDEYWVFDDPLIGSVLSEASVAL